MACFAAFAPNVLTVDNAVIMTKHVALNAFLAIRMTLVIVSGGIDLSVGAIVGLCAMVAGCVTRRQILESATARPRRAPQGT